MSQTAIRWGWVLVPIGAIMLAWGWWQIRTDSAVRFYAWAVGCLLYAGGILCFIIRFCQ